MSYGKQEVGSAFAEPTQAPKKEIPEGEDLCSTCLAAPVCHVRIAISTTAPHGGIEIGACGFYSPDSTESVEPEPEVTTE
jgi:hypothetical protein